MQKFIQFLFHFISMIILSSCSLFGIQREEGPKYHILVEEEGFEIREYAPYILAQTTIEGDYDNDSGKAFRILAGYIFGKNKGEKKLAMTAPVGIKEKSISIPMTSPVTLDQVGKNFTMSFYMPSKYTLSELPEPIDDRIKFVQIPSKTIAVHRYTWLSSKQRNKKMANELRQWLKTKNVLAFDENDYSYAGYNPPWTIPFLKRNEIHIELKDYAKKEVMNE